MGGFAIVGTVCLRFLPYQEVLGHSYMELWPSEDFSCPEVKVGALRPFPCACWLRNTDADDGVVPGYGILSGRPT